MIVFGVIFKTLHLILTWVVLPLFVLILCSLISNTVIKQQELLDKAETKKGP